MMPVLTMGYGKRSLEDVLVLLRRHHLGYVVDVRSSPWSKFKPEFSREPLAAVLAQNSVRYVFMGDELGGRPDDPTCYDEAGHVDYLACRERQAFKQGIERLCSASAGGHRVVILCSEGRPEDCHRTKLVAEVLVERGIEVQHIDEGDVLRTHGEVLQRLSASQMSLLGDDNADLLNRSRGRYAPPVEA
jgi:uncharacterized protein (DUF488 family)